MSDQEREPGDVQESGIVTTAEVGPVIGKINVCMLDVPKSVHRAWKILSAVKGYSMKESLKEALEFWIKEEGKKLDLKEIME